MLNELDDLLCANGIQTKIVFLLYCDLLWAPQTERLKNPDRFILMFAPITRTYSGTFSTQKELDDTPVYIRNQCELPESVEENIAFLRGWQKLFGGDSFDFDYHYMWDHYCDPGYSKIAETLTGDIKNLKTIGLNGLISCQSQRVFLPTGFGMYAMGMTLWNDKLDSDYLAVDYFNRAFGADGQLCRGYLNMLSELFDPPYLRGEKPRVSEENERQFKQIPAYVEIFRPVIKRNLSLADKCHKRSWEIIDYHADICCSLAGILEAYASGELGKAMDAWQKLETLVQEKEIVFQPEFDVYNFIDTLRNRGFIKRIIDEMNHEAGRG